MPPTALALYTLLYPLRQSLKAGPPLPSKVLGIDADCLIVAVGSGCPYRLLVLHSDQTGLIHIRLWTVQRRLEEVTKTVMADLVGDVLKQWATEYHLGA
jgi:hypothetical protein